MVIKISTKTSDDRGIPVIVDDEMIGFITDAPDTLKNVLKAMLEGMADMRKDIEEKDDWIEELLENEREMYEWLEDDEDWWRGEEE